MQLEDIARQITSLEKRVQHLEILEIPDRAMILIDSTVLTVAVASVTFAAIPLTHSHLLLLYYARSDRAAINDSIAIRFNGDAGNNYDYIVSQERQPSTLFTAEGIGVSYTLTGFFAGGTAAAGIFGGGMIRIPNYINTIGQKVVHSLYDNKFAATTGNVRNGQSAGFWRDTSAITSITAISTSASNFVADSRFDLYGME